MSETFRVVRHDPTPIEDGERRTAPLVTIDVPYTPSLVSILFGAYRAVLEQLGERPTHFLAGWETYAQLTLAPLTFVERLVERPADEAGARRSLSILGLPIYLDPTRGRFLAAVPAFDRIVGREMPKGSMWP